MKNFVEIECIGGKRKKYIYKTLIPIDVILEASTLNGKWVLYYKSCGGCGWEEKHKDDPYYRAEYTQITNECYNKIKKILEITEVKL